MRRHTLTAAIFVSLFISIFSQMVFAGNTLETVGAISSVTVYRGQALVTRTIEVELPAGSTELVVGKLPGQIISESLYVHPSDKISVSGVRYREKTLKEYAGKEANEIDMEIEKLNREFKHVDRDIAQGSNMWQRYDPLWSLAKEVSQAEPNKALDVEPVEKLTGFLEEKLNTIHKNSLEMEDRRDDLQKEINKLQEKKDELLRNKEVSRREAVLFVSSDAGGKAVIHLSYLVRGPSWIPQYNLRATPAEGNVFIEYNAVIHQNSDEDWQNVAINLSTAEPTTIAYPPMLEPMKVKVGPPAPAAPVQTAIDVEKGQVPQTVRSDMQEQQVAYRDLSDKFRGMERSKREMAREGKAAQRMLNEAAGNSQMMELQADRAAVQVMQTAAKGFARTEGVSVSYSLAGRFTIPGKTGQQLATVNAFKAKGEFVMIATPLLTNYVYLMADIVNSSDSVLLSGPVNMYCSGDFVGKGELGLVTVDGKFTAGFGVDSQVQISREFKDKKVDSYWRGSRVETYDYRLAIENYKSSKVKLRLIERIPYTEDTNLEIKDLQTNTPLSSDAEYLRTEKDKGILRWDLELAPNTAGQNAKIVTYSYTIKYSSDMKIQPATGAD
jgi:hypothetical protein